MSCRDKKKKRKEKKVVKHEVILLTILDKVDFDLNALTLWSGNANVGEEIGHLFKQHKHKTPFLLTRTGKIKTHTDPT